jgi:hypothetical protein
MKRIITLAAIAAGVALVLSATLLAQNPPARGLRWSKAAPFRSRKKSSTGR